MKTVDRNKQATFHLLAANYKEPLRPVETCRIQNPDTRRADRYVAPGLAAGLGWARLGAS